MAEKCDDEAGVVRYSRMYGPDNYAWLHDRAGQRGGVPGGDDARSDRDRVLHSGVGRAYRALNPDDRVDIDRVREHAWLGGGARLSVCAGAGRCAGDGGGCLFARGSGHLGDAGLRGLHHILAGE